jgi:hypothetical protein
VGEKTSSGSCRDEWLLTKNLTGRHRPCAVILHSQVVLVMKRYFKPFRNAIWGILDSKFYPSALRPSKP